MRIDCRTEGDVLQLAASCSEEERRRALDFMGPESRDFTQRLLGSTRVLERAQGCIEILIALETQQMLNRVAIT